MGSGRPIIKGDTVLIEGYENTKGLGLGGRSMTRALGLGLLVLLGSISVLGVRLRGWPLLHVQWSAGDFQVFYQAALDTARGRDPYVRPAYHSIPAFTAFVRLFTLLPRPYAYAIWVSMLAAAQGLGMLLLATRHGYRAVLALLALSPAVLLTLLVGQPVPLLVLGLAAALYAVEHDRPVLAGACLAIVWVKPQIALPAAVFFALCRPRMALGFLLASAALLVPPSLPAWLHNITHFVVQSQNVQESPAGLWPQLLGAHRAGYLVMLVLAVGASVLVQRRAATPARTLAWLLLIWFIAAPYSRPYDLALLAIPAAVLGPLLPAVLLDCWLATALSFYSLSTAAVVAPLLMLPVPRRPVVTQTRGGTGGGEAGTTRRLVAWLPRTTRRGHVSPSRSPDRGYTGRDS
jgi:hypothetical protein